MKLQSVRRHLLSNNDNVLQLIERFYIKTEEGAKGQGSGERESEGESGSVGRVGTQHQS